MIVKNGLLFTDKKFENKIVVNPEQAHARTVNNIYEHTPSLW